jgi:hypothetical protein
MSLKEATTQILTGALSALLAFVPNTTTAALAQGELSHCVPGGGALMTNIGAIADVSFGLRPSEGPTNRDNRKGRHPTKTICTWSAWGRQKGLPRSWTVSLTRK